ncbi:MAG: hypothetical protein NVS2B17_20650 [Candidatus Velthaea sp.]
MKDWLVEDPRTTAETVRLRAALRKQWHRAEREAESAAEQQPFGENWHHIESALANAPGRYPMVPVDSALDGLRRAIASANATRPTRTTAASGAG